MWNKINVDAYNPHLTYEVNNKNGMNLPTEWTPVLICDVDDSKIGYFVGRFYQDTLTKEIYCMTCWKWKYKYLNNLRWQYFDFCEEA